MCHFVGGRCVTVANMAHAWDRIDVWTRAGRNEQPVRDWESGRIGSKVNWKPGISFCKWWTESSVRSVGVLLLLQPGYTRPPSHSVGKNDGDARGCGVCEENCGCSALLLKPSRERKMKRVRFISTEWLDIGSECRDTLPRPGRPPGTGNGNGGRRN